MHSKHKSKFIEKSFITRLFLRYFSRILVVVVVPLLILSMFTYSIITKSAQHELKAMQEVQLRTIGNNFDNLLTGTAKRFLALGATDWARVFFMHPPGYQYPVELYYTYQQSMYNEVLSEDSLHSVYFYSCVNDTVMTHTSAPISLQSFPDQSWHNSLEDLPTLPFFEARALDNSTNNFKKVISYYVPIHILSESVSGYIILNFDLSGIDKALGYRISLENQDFFVVDQTGTVIYNRRNDQVLQPFMLEYLPDHTVTDVVNHNHESYLCASAPSTSNSYYYVLWSPLHALSSQQQRVSMTFVPFTLGLILFSSILSYFLAHKGYMPIHTMLLLFEQNLLKDPDTHKHRNEWDLIRYNVLSTLSEKKNIEKQLSDTLLNYNKVYSSALQAQINPHFLYNTLENIRITILLNNQGEDCAASLMVERLSDLFRILMQSDEHLTTMEEEIKYAKLYIDIIQMRYQQQLQVKWDIPKALLSARIVKISLQPLIENAIEHGLKQVPHTGEICISAVESNNELQILVSNNGKQISPELRDKLNQEMKDSCKITNQHIGMINTNNRIRLLFGDDYGIQILDSKEGLTQVQLRLPFITFSAEADLDTGNDINQDLPM